MRSYVGRLIVTRQTGSARTRWSMRRPVEIERRAAKMRFIVSCIECRHSNPLAQLVLACTPASAPALQVHSSLLPRQASIRRPQCVPARVKIDPFAPEYRSPASRIMLKNLCQCRLEGELHPVLTGHQH